MNAEDIQAEADRRYPPDHIVDDPFGETGEAHSDPYGYDEVANRAFREGVEWILNGPALDPKPWYVEEADEGRHDEQGRYSMDVYRKSAEEGEYGGPIYGLAVWKPRPGYEQNKEKYA